MAGDLIPPPSPAGRPQPGGGPPRPEPSARAAADPAAPPPPPDPPGRRAGQGPYRRRFGFVLGALAGIALGAVAVAAVLAIGQGGSAGRRASAPALAAHWSAWRPAAPDLIAGPKQIAEHVSTRYRDDRRRQIAVVEGKLLAVQTTAGPEPLRVLLDRGDGARRAIDGLGVLYELNGHGDRGAFAKGEGGARAARLLRREALELSLYSFRYLGKVDMVVTLLPPAAPDGGIASPGGHQDAVFYRPGDLAPQLRTPLGATLPATVPTPRRMGGPEADVVARLTRGNRFRATYVQLQSSTPYLLLERGVG